MFLVTPIWRVIAYIYLNFGQFARYLATHICLLTLELVSCVVCESVNYVHISVLVIHLHRRMSYQLSRYDSCLATLSELPAVMQAAKTDTFCSLLLYWKYYWEHDCLQGISLIKYWRLNQIGSLRKLTQKFLAM